MNTRLLNALLLANEIFDNATHDELLLIANAILKAFDEKRRNFKGSLSELHAWYV